MDSTLWQNRDTSPVALSACLATHLFSKPEVASQWLASNRGCFLLSSLLQVPSARETVSTILQGPICKAALSSMEGRAKEQEGAKCLVQELGAPDTQIKGGGGPAKKAKGGPAKKKR